jgi:aryl-alcohol dehydrogenase-like predicted oxidoreductase
VKRAFDLGIRCIDTSPYYEPSEPLIGEALASHIVTNSYARSDYILMTKVGRIGVKKFDYSPEWIRASIARSLKRLHTDYLDVVFVHDVEFMPLLTSLIAISTLFTIANEQPGIIRNIGISGYDLLTITKLARLTRDHLHLPLDTVQVWAQLTLQNSTLATNAEYGIAALRDAGVQCVFCSSPLAAGLLRDSGVPVGALGDWHPAPPALREACLTAAEWVSENSEVLTGRKCGLASLALRSAITKAWDIERGAGGGRVAVRTIVGISSIDDLEANVKTARLCLKPVGSGEGDGIAPSDVLDETAAMRDQPLYHQIFKLLHPWFDYDFSTQQQVPDHTADMI